MMKTDLSIPLPINPQKLYSDRTPNAVVHQLFEYQVTQSPAAIAILFDSDVPECAPTTITYEELNARANQLAHYLARCGVGDTLGPEPIIGLYMERSVEMVVGLLAILKAGGVYLPLDPTYPRERLAFMAEDAGVQLLLTQHNLQKSSPCPHVKQISVDQAWPQIAMYPQTNPALHLTSNQLAYVIYTSGSTGRPKGVLVEHKGLCNLVAVQHQHFALQPGDRVLQAASLNFDASIWEMVMALCSGATLCVAPAHVLLPGPELTAFLAQHCITHVTLVPSALAALSPTALPALQTVIVAGEACPTGLAQKWLLGRRFFNAYGPTETTICATIMECTPASLGPVAPPIGKPIANVTLYILDEAWNPVADGESGELYIGGATLARGYLNRPELTAARFIANPFGEGRLYKTGDLVRRLPDGNLDFLGRIDHQVKIRGVRVELGEIEAQLISHPQVQQAVAKVHVTAEHQQQLVAYVVMAKEVNKDIDSAMGDELVDEAAVATALRARLRTFLQQKLPAPMIPAAFVLLDALPRMPSSKIDRAALPSPVPADFVTATFVPPQTPTEAVLVTIWQELLGIPQVGRNDDFFAGGGHSLLAMQALARIRAHFGVELLIRTFFAAPTPAMLGAHLDRAEPQAIAALPKLEPVERRPSPMPLSYAQERLWFLSQLQAADNSYNIAFPLHLQGPLEIRPLHAALQAVVDRHEILRTTFPVVDGVACQQIAATYTLPLPVIDVPAEDLSRTHLSAIGGHEDGPSPQLLEAVLHQAAQQPFDLATGPLFQATLYRFHTEAHLLLLRFHHIVVDGWSVGVLLHEVDALYRAYCSDSALDGSAVLPPLPVQFADFTLWQRAWLEAERLDAQRTYWRTVLAGAPNYLPLPTDLPRRPEQPARARTVPFTLDAATTAALAQVCRQYDVTPFMVLYATYALLLARYSGQQDLVIGTTVANRQDPALESLIGFFVNTLPIRADLSGEPTVAELFARLRQQILDAHSHQDIPFDQLVNELQLPRTPGYAPLCQVMLTLDNTHSHAAALGDLRVELLTLPSNCAKFDLTLSFTQEKHTMRGYLEYNCDLFAHETIVRMVAHFQALLLGLPANITTPIRRLQMLSTQEKQLLLIDWNQTASPYPRYRTIPQLFEEQVEWAPDAPALIAATVPCSSAITLTYSQLNAQANQLAHYLQQQGIKPGQFVGLCVERSPLMIVATLAILKAGAAYVPLAPDYPQERLAFMIDDSAAPLILTEAAHAVNLPASVRVLLLDSAWAQIATQPTTNVRTNITADSLAYLMYTSGSTGQPKGVRVTHRNVVRLVRDTDYATFTTADVFLQLAPIAFDAATFEIWGALLNGARLVLMTQGQPTLAAIGETIREYGVTTLWLTAGLFHLMVDEQLDGLRPLRQLLAGGDVLSMSHVRRVLREIPTCRLINGYGPTENTTFTCCYTFPPETSCDTISYDDATVPVATTAPIGRPIANTQVYILDEALQPVPIGIPGELYAGGDGVAAGYHNRPALTAERFIPNPFAQAAGASGADILYKTGDLARWRADGNIEFLGRIDGQVKVRGFRVELGEIEAALMAHGAVRAAAVVAHQAQGRPDSDKQLIAYIVTDKTGTDKTGTDKTGTDKTGTDKTGTDKTGIDKTGTDQSPTDKTQNANTEDKGINLPDLLSALRHHLQQTLPPYMLPAQILPLAALPLSPNGKVDRHALPAPTIAAAAEERLTLSAPQTPTEEVLAAIWATLLDVDPIGREQDFFLLGGHSLLATRVAARIRAIFGIELGVRALFEAPTIAMLAVVIDKERQAQGALSGPAPCENVQSAMLPLRPSTDRPSLLPLSSAQQRLWFLDQLAGVNAIYNIPFPLRLQGPLEPTALHNALNAIIERHESLRTTFPAANGALHQQVATSQAIPLPLIDLQNIVETPTEREHQLQEQLHRELWQPFDLAAGPLVRATLYRLSATEHLLALCFHHIVADGWSLDIFLDELKQAYMAHCAGQVLSLPPLPLQYVDYALWQQAQLEQPALAAQRAYWRQHLADAPTLLPLPTDFPRPARQRFRGGTLRHSLDAQLTHDLHRLSRQQGVSLFMTLYGAFAMLLSRYSGQHDIVIGVPVANRREPALEALIGFFVNTLPLRIDLSANPTVASLLDSVRTVTLDAYANQDLPFEEIVSELQVTRSLSHAPLFQVMLAFNNTQPAQVQVNELTISPVALDTVVSKFDLTLHLHEADGQLHTLWEYDADLFSPNTIAQMVKHFAVLAAAMCAAMDIDATTIQQLPMLTDRERSQLLEAWNQTHLPYPTNRTIQELFAAQVVRTPDAVAVILDKPALTGSPVQSERLTYRQLEERANQLAYYLRTKGVQPGTPVGLSMERSVALLIGLLGILKAGGAYVPLDPTYPQERLAFMMADTAMPIVLTQQSLSEHLPTTAAELICLDSDWSLMCQLPSEPPTDNVQSTDLAYVIYTSGSTGQPKGVMVTHQNLVHSTTARFHTYEQPVERFLLLSSFAFDSSVAGIFWTLCQGGTLVLPQPGEEKDPYVLAELIERQAVTHLLALPSLYHLLLTCATPAQLRSLQVAIVAGEACPVSLPTQHSAQLPNATLYNEYGPTEGTVWSTVYKCPAQWTGTTVPIGHPIPNMQLYILDASCQPVPVGVSGELYIGGAGIAAGYLNRPALTAEKFIDNPFSAQPGAKLYRTGDLVRYASTADEGSFADGPPAVEFLGRIDGQIKVRGFRIEIGEIETALTTHPQIRESVIIAQQEVSGGHQLVAYFVPTADVKEADTDLIHNLRLFLHETLPDYMIPSHFVALTAFPLTPNGKVDRKAFPAPTLSPTTLSSESSDNAPQTATEQRLGTLWQSLLRRERVGAKDDFFLLGGHSLLLAHLAAQIRQTFGKRIPLQVLFQSSTLAAMATVIDAPVIDATEKSSPAQQPKMLPMRSNQRNLNKQTTSPYIHYVDEPIAHAIHSGTIQPVDAAAFGYWPEELAYAPGQSVSTIIEQHFRNKATVSSILETEWGRIAVILLPRRHSALYVDPTLVATIDEGLAFAQSLGARMVSLTGILPSATDYGRALLTSSGQQPNLPQVTTGHAMTAASVVLNVEHILEEAGRTLSYERVACLGLGSIGLSSLRLLLQVAPHPQQILLCDLASKEQQLHAIGAELRQQYAFRGEIQIVSVRNEVPSHIYTATLVLGATNVPDVLDVARLSPGTLLVDDSGPHCFDPQLAITRFEQQQDLLFTEGGAIQLPTPMRQTIYRPPQLEMLFAEGALTEPRTIMGCAFSSLLSAKWPTLVPTIGEIDPATALTYYRTIKAMEICAAPLHCADYLLPSAPIALFRERHRLF